MSDDVDANALPKLDSDESSPEATAQWILWIVLALVGIGGLPVRVQAGNGRRVHIGGRADAAARQ